MDVHAKLAEVRQAIEQARSVPMSASAVVNRREQAERLVAEARDERDRLVSDSEVYRVARRRADEDAERARREGDELRREADDYVDGRLANLEVALQRTMEAVTRGRERLAVRSALGSPADGEANGKADGKADGAVQDGPVRG